MSTLTIGLDVGDRRSQYGLLDGEATVRATGSVQTTRDALTALFAALPPARVGLEAGIHSPWVSRLVRSPRWP